ncbi:hypothetical protein [Marinifilum sp. D737]|uniref:hypothetical protein n=1 Tax=Marinifilum sp. D737 TaxID=2969628 RepID=UPI00227457EA|nr:hypothetical protein [Marinifilum sp. D737]MCY1634883.1 hypothetical protein [Marinifilum sp. D737]
MFAYSDWNFFCKELSKNKKQLLIANELSKLNEDNFVLIKHDVETNAKKALRIAKIESNYNIRSTYYVQSYLLNDESNLEIFREIQDMGHEVTYHYDVLDSNNGDWTAAELEFDETLKKFKDLGFDVMTVCPHGNPVMNRNGWSSNKDFFRKKSIKEKYSNILDIVVDFPSLSKNKIAYVSDAGYRWNLITDIANNDNTEAPNVPLKGIKGLVELLNKEQSLIISSHPHRWVKFRFLLLLRIYMFKVIRSTVNLLSRIPLVKRILSKFYFLAKKL